jgi:hypothetical protein
MGPSRALCVERPHMCRPSVTKMLVPRTRTRKEQREYVKLVLVAAQDVMSIVDDISTC